MFKKRILKLGAVLALGLLAFGAVGFRTSTAHAQTVTPPVAQPQACSAEQANDAGEVNGAGADTDTVDLQCGDQTGVDSLSAGPEAAGIEAVGSAPDTDSVQSGGQAGDQTGSQVEDGQPDLPGAAPEAGG